MNLQPACILRRTQAAGCLQRLVEAGDSVVVIEHNLDVIKTADYLIDLGPEGGDKGGTLVACGTPEELAKVKKILHRPVCKTGFKTG